jgi:hypothetical protein
MSRTTRIPAQRCRRCNYPFKASTYFHGQAQPFEGCASICIECGLLQIFSADMILRDPTPEEKYELERNQQVIDLQFARAALPPRKRPL